MIRPLAALAAAALAITLAGCAEVSPGSAPGPSASATAMPVPARSATPVPSGGTDGTAVLTHLDVHSGPPPVRSAAGPAWRPRSVSPSASSVEIGWYDSASPSCGAVNGVWVTETATTVTIDLTRAARRPGMLCAMVLVPRRAVVPLGAPLGDRQLLQAPAPSTVPRSTCAPSSGPIRPAVLCPLTPGR